MMSATAFPQCLRGKVATLSHLLCLVILVNISIRPSIQQSDTLAIKTDPFYIDLYHKFNSKADFTPRGSILVRPKTEYRPAQASIISQNDLNEEDLKLLKGESNNYVGDNTYYLRAVSRKKKSDNPEKVTETILKSCTLLSSNLNDFLSVNLNALNEFISVNLYTLDPECLNPIQGELSSKFNTTVHIHSSQQGPQPDTTTYIKRLEEERQNKMKEGKEDNRSFFTKYWMYIVPGVVILMMLGGPEQGAR